MLTSQGASVHWTTKDQIQHGAERETWPPDALAIADRLAKHQVLISRYHQATPRQGPHGGARRRSVDIWSASDEQGL